MNTTLFAVIAALAAVLGTAAFFIKRHRGKGKYAACALLAAVILCATPLTAYAKTDEDRERDIDLSEILTPLVPAEPVPTPTPEPQPLTPPGNLNLVDDISGEQAEDKQFITVVTKNGNYFYIIIDRASDNQNVHFLNLVDEADLLALLEDEKKPAAPTPAPVVTTPEPTPEPDPEPEPKSNNLGGTLIMLLLDGALGGGAYYYFKILKPKQGAAKSAATSELDEFAFDEDEDDFDGMAYYEPDGGRLPDSAGHEDDTPEEPAEPQDGDEDFTFDMNDFNDESEGK
jgi:hypothetical protein